MTMTTSPPTVQERIALAAAEHSRLLQTLSETDYIPTALKENGTHIASLKTQITEKQSLATTLDSQRVREKQLHQKHRDSTVRRLLYNISGQKDGFAERVVSVERQYLETTQDHREATRCVESLRTQLAEAEETQTEFEGVQTRRRDAKEALDKLYDSIFEGPTPAFPDEDEAELAAAEARHTLYKLQDTLRREVQVPSILEQGWRILAVAAHAMLEAERASAAGLRTGGDYKEVEERMALAEAGAKIKQLRVLMQEALELSKDVGSLGPMEIPNGYYRDNTWSSNYLRESAFHRRIEESRVQLRGAMTKMREEKYKAERRAARVKMETDKAEKKWNEAKRRLCEVRKGVFERVTRGLPEY